VTARCVMVGREDQPPQSWCGRKLSGREWYFTNESHALVYFKNADGVTGIAPCKKCLRAMVELLEKTLAF